MAKTLKIDTILGAATSLDVNDELLLSKLDGSEGVSVPFTYDLVLMRQASKANVDEKLKRIIGSSARIGLLRPGQEDLHGPKYIHRVGSFSQFERIGITKNKLLVYKARLIPAVMLWGGGVTFRVFEKMNVVDIISEVLHGIRAHSSDVRFDISRLRKPEFPSLAYCVQFGESSFGFVCRLMAQHGISYFFDRGQGERAGGSQSAENDTLVLVGPKDTTARSCDIGILKARTADDLNDQRIIGAFSHSGRPSKHLVSIGNYNLVSPTKPLHADKAIAQQYDLLFFDSAARASVLRREEFPAPVSRDPDPDENRFVKDHAEQAMRRDEQDVFTVSGVVKNSSFVAGRTFKLEEDEALGQFAQRTFQLTMVKINAFENSYGSTTGDDVGDVFIGFGLGVLHALTFNIFKKDGLDMTTAMADVAFDNYLQKQQEVALAKWWYPQSKSKHEGGGVDLPGGASKWAALALGNFADTVKNIINRNEGAFSMKFAAVPWDQGMFLRPQVSASRPVAEGPQLATVVGPKGSTKGQSFVDHQLGRVRVRFPWHQKLSEEADFLDRFETDRTTAWVPVSQVWAGTRIGSQFLPRVGDQVVVEYLDGDPERPIVTGCLYHADTGSSHLPFLNEGLHGRQVTTRTLFEAAGQTVTLSGIHTHSTPSPESGRGRYHLLRFDDRYNDEQLLMRSQGRLDVTAKCSHFETTEGNRHVLVKAGTDAEGKKVGGGSSFMTIGGEHDVHVGDSRYEAIDTDQQLTVKGDAQFDIKGDWIGVVGGKLSLNAGTIVIEAAQKLTLKVGGSTVVLNPCGVYIDGALIHNQGGGPADTAADATIKDVADAANADPGEPAYMRTEMPGGCKGSGGGGGGRRGERTVPAQHGLPCTLDSEQMICLSLPQLCAD